MRVVLFHNVVAPYRHALFAALARLVDLEVWFAAARSRDRQWSSALPGTYPARILRDRTLHAFARPLTVCPELGRALRAARPDVVVSVLTRANALDVLRLVRFCRRRTVPLVLLVGAIEEDPVYRSGVPGALNALFERYHRVALGAAAGCLYYGERSRAWAERRGARGAAFVGTQVLPPPPLAPRLEPSAPGAPVRLLFVGKLEARKGVERLVDALAALPPARRDELVLRLAGSGPLQEPLAAAARAGGVAVEALGFVDRDALWPVYRDADLLVLPSLHDPWANVVNEAMSVGTPVLASVQSGASELAARAGWTADMRDPAALRAALGEALATCREPRRRPEAVRAESTYRPEPAAAGIAALLAAVAAGRPS